MTKVFVGVTNTGTIVRGLAQVLCFWMRNQKVQIIPYISAFNYPMEAHRNLIVTEFLKTDAEFLLWLDDDVVPPVDILDKLIAHDKDIITAVAFCTRPNDYGVIFPYAVTLKRADNGEFNLFYGDGLDEIDACGGGAVMVKRKVYEHPAMKAPYRHTYKEDGTLGMTCDFKFCLRAKEAGFKVFSDSTILCSHLKTMDLKEFNRSVVWFSEVVEKQLKEVVNG